MENNTGSLFPETLNEVLTVNMLVIKEALKEDGVVTSDLHAVIPDIFDGITVSFSQRFPGIDSLVNLEIAYYDFYRNGRWEFTARISDLRIPIKHLSNNTRSQVTGASYCILHSVDCQYMNKETILEYLNKTRRSVAEIVYKEIMKCCDLFITGKKVYKTSATYDCIDSFDCNFELLSLFDPVDPDDTVEYTEAFKNSDQWKTAVDIFAKGSKSEKE